jgi:hypothetical protein
MLDLLMHTKFSVANVSCQKFKFELKEEFFVHGIFSPYLIIEYGVVWSRRRPYIDREGNWPSALGRINSLCAQIKATT